MVWQAAGTSESFAIPKELLWGLKAAWTGIPVYHIGDSTRREWVPAEQQGVAFVWHSDFASP